MPNGVGTVVAGLMLFALTTLDTAHAVEHAHAGAEKKGTIPMGAGGYSKVTKARMRESPVHTGRRIGRVSSHFQTVTVGIVTQIQGTAVVVGPKINAVITLLPGQGVTLEDTLWVPSGSFIEVFTVTGDRVSVAGPTTFSLLSHSKVRLYRGKILITSQEERAFGFETAMASGLVPGAAVVWTDDELETSQIFTLSGKTKVWHPELETDPTEIPEGHFAESSRETSYLQSSYPKPTDLKQTQRFLSRFFEQNFTLEQAQRSLAAVKKEKTDWRGSRKPSEVSERRPANAQKWLMSKLQGKEIHLPENGQGLKRARGLEIRKIGENLDEEQRKLLRQLGH